MDPVKTEIEIQAVNLAQQWYSLPHERLPELPTLLKGYLHCFGAAEDRQAFLEEALRIMEEMKKSPKEDIPESHTTLFKETLMSHLQKEQKG